MLDTVADVVHWVWDGGGGMCDMRRRDGCYFLGGGVTERDCSLNLTQRKANLPSLGQRRAALNCVRKGCWNRASCGKRDRSLSLRDSSDTTAQSTAYSPPEFEYYPCLFVPRQLDLNSCRRLHSLRRLPSGEPAVPIPFSSLPSVSSPALPTLSRLSPLSPTLPKHVSPPTSADVHNARPSPAGVDLTRIPPLPHTLQT
ncbi:hypothetical protein BC835DRAFT_140326 [Cytidiella melzeri]|nr:hypothetical protein BC835DRAFT_140326 [Cytidiella melzeri]